MLTLIYNVLTILISAYFFINLYIKENQFFIFAIYIVKSKFYFCLMLNFMAMISINLAKIFIKVFFGEIRLSELIVITFYLHYLHFLASCRKN